MNIVITGSSKGMGKSMAERFASAKYSVLLCARNKTQLYKTRDELKKAHPEASITAVVADLSRKEGMLTFRDYVLENHSPVDVLINNSGTFIPGSVWNEPDGALEQMLDSNLLSAYHITRALLPQMMERKSGHIFNICSIASLQAYSNGGAYSISKYALSGFSKNLRKEMIPYNIKVTAVYPGAVYTDSWASTGLPEERFIPVEDIAELVFSIAHLSPRTCVEEIVVRPQQGDLP